MSLADKSPPWTARRWTCGSAQLPSPAPGEQRAEIQLEAVLWTERPADYTLLFAFAALGTVALLVAVSRRLVLKRRDK